MSHQTAKDLAEAVRAACVDAAVAAYEDAGIQGLCADGRWEAAVAALRQVDLSGLFSDRIDEPHAESAGDSGPRGQHG